MKFHFDFDIPKLSPPIEHTHKLFLIGSCFTENIGEKLRKYKFDVLENSHGILFNPISVAEAMDDYINNKVYTEDDIFSYNEGWHSWKHHSRYSALSANEALGKINNAVSQTHGFLKSADYVMITLGSAWVYKLTEKASHTRPGQVAANNHKAPAEWFRKELLKPAELIDLFENVIHKLIKFNPDLKIIFTISPVRHLREGVVENNRSKAVLIHAVHEMVSKFEKLYYFPAYEIVIDDLRDYRFYAEDLVHPNYQATQYVWEKFVTACMGENTKGLIEEIHSINLAYQHKPFNATSEQHKKFLLSYKMKTKSLQQKFPYLNFNKELEFFSK
ncbi:MAG: GSCFA domain-containing protein [Bacteroidota bacterium]|nr:GSCFA domain-containing protein [Bacteroidota bacterium]